VEIGEKSLGPNHLDLATWLKDLALLLSDPVRYRASFLILLVWLVGV